MNVIIRTDASTKIGTGHLMRCLALADGLRNKGAHVWFICRKEPGNLIRHIETEGYKVFSLPNGLDSITDRNLTLKIIKKHNLNSDWLVVDHYGLNISYESFLRGYFKKIMVIDDFAARRHDCDLLLDQNYHATNDSYKRLIPEYCSVLLGPKYALLHPQFQQARKNLRGRNGKIKRILISMGGADLLNETCKVLRALEMLNRPDIINDVIVGSSNPHYAEIKSIAAGMPNTVCRVNIKNMAELMAAADLCIGAGGTGVWERCCLGLASIVIAIAENQKNVIDVLARKSIIISLGWHHAVSENDIAKAIEKLMQNPQKIGAMSGRSKKLVDGKGVHRVIERMFLLGEAGKGNIGLVIKNATLGDIKDLFKWRNHSEIRKNSFNDNLIAWDEHKNWFRKKLNDPGCCIYMAYAGKRRMGSIRFEDASQMIKTSVMLNPRYIGKGYGAEVIKEGVKQFIYARNISKPIVAQIKKDNIASKKVFQKAGFIERHTTFVFEHKL